MDDEGLRELRSWGIGLIVLGFFHLVLAGFLDPVWGVVIIGIGTLNLLIQQRGMFIVNGGALLTVGLLNILGGAWAVFGVFQLVWGVQEIRKFRRYPSAGKPEEEEESSKRSATFAGTPQLTYVCGSCRARLAGVSELCPQCGAQLALI